MTNNHTLTTTLKTMFAATAISALLALGASPAQADADHHNNDKRSCFSEGEFRDLKRDIFHLGAHGKVQTGPTRRVIEEFTETVGLGIIDTDLSDDKQTVVDYRLCGYTFDPDHKYEVQGGHVTLIYWRHAGAAVYIDKTTKGQPNGPERPF